MSALWIAAAALAGFVLPFQAAANAELGRQTPTLFHAALINFVVGAVLFEAIGPGTSPLALSGVGTLAGGGGAAPFQFQPVTVTVK